MAFVTGQGTQHGPLLNFGVATKTGTQSFGASSSYTTISGMSCLLYTSPSPRD